MKYKVGDKVRVRIDLEPYEMYGSLTFLGGNMSKSAGQICTIKRVRSDKKSYVYENPFAWSEEMLEPITLTLSEVKDGKIDCIVHARTQEEANILCKELGTDSGWHIPANECWRYYNKDTWYIIQNGLVHQFGDEDCRLAYPSMPTCEFSDLFATGGVCTGFRSGKISVVNDLIVPRAEMERAMDGFLKTLEETSVKFGIKNFEHKLKEEEKMSTKFTFYTEEGYRIDKSNNTRIPTMTTEVLVNGKDYQYTGSATCDKTDYSEREGVLNAIANAVCGGNFDREFNKVMKNKAFANKKSRTCTYCGQLFDTVAEKEEHEAWHVECRKARHERYLLRKRAKEIAFEEAAQKMAKEMMGEQK